MSDENKDITIRLEYDDQIDDVISKVNWALEKYNLQFVFDGESHDGFEILELVETKDKTK